MAFYGIRVKDGNPFSIHAATRVYGDGMDEKGIRSDTVRQTINGALEVGDFDRQPVFATSDLDLAKIMVLTLVGYDYRNEIVVAVPFGKSKDDLEVVDLATMQAVSLEPCSEDVLAIVERIRKLA